MNINVWKIVEKELELTTTSQSGKSSFRSNFTEGNVSKMLNKFPTEWLLR